MVTIQETKPKEPKPWREAGCAKSCWFARKDKCKCRCRKANHGRGWDASRTEEDPILTADQAEVFRTQMTTTTCRKCGADIKNEPIHYYEHDAGWKVKGMDKLQWLYIRCPCGNQIALWKMGALR